MLSAIRQTLAARCLGLAWTCQLKLWGICLALVLVCVPLSMAQTTAAIVGQAVDASGAAVPGIKVMAKNTATGLEYEANTDGSGNYNIVLLPPGAYALRVETTGFKAWTASVTLAAGDRLRQEIALQVGDVSQTVEVNAAPPALQTENATIGNLITSAALDNLPLNGRNFINLVQLTAGAYDPAGRNNSGWATGANPDDRRRSSAVSVNGQSGTANNYMVDGMDDNERFIGTLIIKPTIESMAEMRVESNAYSAEIGRVSGGVMNVITKSGTNNFHGSLFEFFRNEKLDAANFFATAGQKPPYKQNQYGGSIGGPIVKNRMFFFGDFEDLRTVEGRTFNNQVPTAAMKQGNFQGLATIYDPITKLPFTNNTIPNTSMDPVGLKLINMYPDPNSPDSRFIQSVGRTQRDSAFDVRVDNRISDSNFLFGRYTFNDTNTLTPDELPIDSNTGLQPNGGSGWDFSGTALQRAQNATIGLTHTFSSNLVGEFKAAYSRLAINSLPSNYGTNAAEKLGIANINLGSTTSHMPIFFMSQGYSALGDSMYIPLITYNNVYQPLAHLIYNHGRHNIRTGFDARLRQVAQFQSASGVGQYTFDQYFTADPATGAGGNTMASLLTGYPSSTQRNLYLVSMPGYRTNEYAWFVQDDWRATPWLTLNVGIRYDYFGPISEQYNRISNFDPIAAKMVIAGQDGVSSSANVNKDLNNFAPRFGFAATPGKNWVIRGGYGVSYVPHLFGTDNAFRNAPFSSTYGVFPSTFVPNNRLSDGLPLPTPNSTTDLAYASINAVAFSGTTPYVQQYNISVQHQLPASLTATASYVGLLGRQQWLGPDINSVAPGPDLIDPRRPYASKVPNLQFVEMFGPWYNSNYQALQMNLERRFSKGFGVLANYTWAHAIDNSDVFYGADNAVVLKKGNSDGDQRHHFTLTSNYALPFTKSRLGRGWQINAILTWQTGIPMTFGNGITPLNGGGPSRVNLIRDPMLDGSQRTLDHWFDTSVLGYGCTQNCAFAVPAAYTYGTQGRNMYFGPSHFNLDLSVRRDFNVTERLRLEFRAESFNITNTPPFGNPDTTIGDAALGMITSAGDPRRIQLALKLVF